MSDAMNPNVKNRFLLCSLVVALSATVYAGDWPMWGRNATRNMVSDETGLPDTLNAGKFVGATDEIDFATTEPCRDLASCSRDLAIKTFI